MVLNSYSHTPFYTGGSGGVVTLSLTGTDSTQFADHACKKFYVIAENADDVQFSIDADVSTDNYAYISQGDKGNGSVTGGWPLCFELDNTNHLYVKGENGDIVYYWWIAD